MKIYRKQWDTMYPIYGNLSQTRGYMTIYLVKEASRHGLPLILGENGIQINLLHLITIEVES